MPAPVHTSAGRRSVIAVLSLAVSSACGGGGGTTGSSDPTSLSFTAGANQTGQVGAALPAKVTVEARSGRGPVAAITIVMAADPTAGGSVSPRTATTASDGTAQFTWTLGGKLGVQTLSASTTGATPLHSSLSATALAAPASIVQAASEAFQLVVVGHAVPLLPLVQVTDAFGNPIAGIAVTFEAVQGASVLTGTSQTSDAQGHATLGGWILGSAALSYTIRGRISSGAAAVFEARGIPAAITAIAGTNQTANVGTAVPIAPAVKATRDDGSPLSDVTVNFTVVSGGGSVTGTGVVTGADGIARPTRWVLGLTPGSNRLEASTLGRSSINFDATGAAAVPAFSVASGGGALSGFFGNYLIGSPEVTVTDAQGNPVAGATVNFQVAQGGGQLAGFAPPTDFLGHASVLSWRLGPAGTQSVSATTGALPPVLFTATGSAPPASTFRIEVRYPTQPTDAQRAAFDAAVARWTQLIIGGAAPYTVVPSDGSPDCPTMTGETVNGLVIYAELQAIDGPGKVLGATYVCVVRDLGFLPVQAVMLFDTADLASFASQFTTIVLHEMAHAIGFGTIWNFTAPGLGTNEFLVGTTSDPTFNGLGARSAFYGAVAPGTAFTGIPVPVEAGGGPGTAFSHWRESTFGSELMTGFLNSGTIPLSAMTVQQFRDLGYLVDDATSDVYTFQALIQSFGAPTVQLVEGQVPGNITVIDRNGRVVGRVPRVFK